jgi:dCTP deaminase
MSFWSGESLRNWIPRFRIIEPFDPNQIDCASYTLKLGREAYITPDYHVGILSKHTIYRLDLDEHFIIPAGQFGFLLTEEVVYVPQHALGFISLRTGLKFRGLINVSGFHVDPGFRGHLIYAVYNAGPSPIHLARGMDLFKIWLADLDRTDSKDVWKGSALIENEHISPTLIDRIPGTILSMNNMSDRLSKIEREWFFAGSLIVTIIAIGGLLFAALKVDWANVLK